jgi:hypothetical protein
MAGAAAGKIVGKSELAEHLGWSRPRLDRELGRNPNFPCISRGDQSGGWKFDLKAVDGYLAGGTSRKPERKPPAIDTRQLRDVVAPPLPAPRRTEVPQPAPRRSAHHSGEATARQRKDEADAALREDKLKVLRGELVDKGEMQQKLADVMAGLAHDLDMLPEQIVKVGGLPEDAAPGLRAMIDQIRTDMVRRAEGILPVPRE